jgi:methionyl aminopeptidase
LKRSLMIVIKTAEEIELMRESNQLVSKTLAEVARHIRPGVSTERLDRVAETFIRDHGAVPGFLGYQGYPKTLCTSVNSEGGTWDPFRKSDPGRWGPDIGRLRGDQGRVLRRYGFQLRSGEVSADVRRLLTVTRESLFKGIEAAVEGNRVGDIGYAVQQHAESAGYSVVREMVGHGLGRNMHEAPEVPNYGRRGSGPKLKKGMVICIEPMINMGRRQIRQEPDGWTIRAADHLPSAHFELAVAIDKGEADILSTFSYIDEVLIKQSN